MTLPFSKLKCKFNSDQEGFSLIEAVIAMAIFSIGVLAVASMQYSTARNTTAGNAMTNALMLAYSQLEALKNTPSASLGALTDTDREGVTELGEDGGVFKLQIRVTDPVPEPGGGIISSDMTRFIRVIVFYPIFGNLTRSVEVSCLTQGNGI